MSDILKRNGFVGSDDGSTKSYTLEEFLSVDMKSKVRDEELLSIDTGHILKFVSIAVPLPSLL